MKNCLMIFLLLLLASILVLTTGCSDSGQAPAVLIPGPAGPKGDQGDVGAPGAPGETGPTGNDGQNGTTGPSGQEGHDGSVGPQGPAGTNGQNGSNGHDGADGQNGSNGHDGAPGQDATPVYSVQFCANQGATTYGHFPEQALCVNHKLYAVFWDGGNAFLAEIAPGAYRTTSTGLICNFTVAANCVVSQ